MEASYFPAGVAAFNLGSDVAHLLKGMNIALVHSGKVKNNIELFKKVTQARGGI